MTHFTTTVVGLIMRPRQTVVALQSGDQAFQVWKPMSGPRMAPAASNTAPGQGGP